MEDQRALLDSLMGQHRNAPLDADIKKLDWRDHEVCKYYLCGFCPHDLFINTKSDLGPCAKVHDDLCRRQYQKSLEGKESSSTKDRYERRFLMFLQDIIYLLDRKIQRAKVRITNEQNADPQLSESQREKIRAIEDRINALTKEMEDLGNQGKVEDAQKVLKVVEGLEIEKQMTSNPQYMTNKKLNICDVCGAFLVENDTAERVRNHLEGKTHQGYAQIREKIEDLLVRKKEREEKEKAEGKKEGKEKEGGDEEDKEKEPKEEGETSGKEKKRERSRSRDRRSRRRRSRSRERRRSDRSRRYRDSGRRRRSRSRH